MTESLAEFVAGRRQTATPFSENLWLFESKYTGAYRFRRGCGGRISGRWRLATIKRAIKNELTTLILLPSQLKL